MVTKKSRYYRGREAAKDILVLDTAASLSADSKEQISRILNESIDWECLWALAEFHGVTPLITRNFLANDLMKSMPQPYQERFSNIYNSSLYKNVIITDELTKVLTSFNNHGISAIILKGTILAEQLYGNPGLRMVTDMDILVQPDDLPLAGSSLRELGYEKLSVKPTWDHPFHEAPYCKQARFPLFIELHRNIVDSRLAAIPQQEIWQRAQRLQLQGGDVLVLSPEDTLLFLSNHFIKHNEHWLMLLCDIAELLNKYAGSMNWGYIVDSARAWQTKTPVFLTLKLAHDILGAPVPESSINALKPGALRMAILSFLVNRDNWISPINNKKLRSETMILYRCLTMDHIRQALAVISRYRGNKKWWGWISTAIWVVLVFAAAACRNLSGFIY